MRAALWAVEKYFTSSESFSTNETRVCMQDYGSDAKVFMNSGSDRSELIAAIKDVILSLEENGLTASSVSVEDNNDGRTFVFRLNM
jgi:hypothetical protein